MPAPSIRAVDDARGGFLWQSAGFFRAGPTGGRHVGHACHGADGKLVARQFDTIGAAIRMQDTDRRKRDLGIAE